MAIKAQHPRYKNLTVTTKWGPIHVDSDGCADLPAAGATVLLSGPYGWKKLEPPPKVTEQVEDEGDEEGAEGDGEDEDSAPPPAPNKKSKKSKK